MAREGGREDKIAAIGVRIRHWVVVPRHVDQPSSPTSSHYAGIVPCGIAEHGVTSLVDLGLPVTMTDLDMALAETFDEVFALGARCASEASSLLPTLDRIASLESALKGSLRRQLREAVGQDVEVDRIDVDLVDPGERRAAAAGFDHLADRVLLADDQRLDRAVAAVAHPAGRGRAAGRSSIAQSR